MELRIRRRTKVVAAPEWFEFTAATEGELFLNPGTYFWQKLF